MCLAFMFTIITNDFIREVFFPKINLLLLVICFCVGFIYGYIFGELINYLSFGNYIIDRNHNIFNSVANDYERDYYREAEINVSGPESPTGRRIFKRT